MCYYSERLQDANARPRPGYKRITRNRVSQKKIFHPSSTTLLSEQHLKLPQDTRIILLINENIDEKERLHFSSQSEVRKTEKKKRCQGNSQSEKLIHPQHEQGNSRNI